MKETRVNKYSEYRSSFSKTEEASFITPSKPQETSLSSSQRLFLQIESKRRKENFILLSAILIILIGIIVGAVIVF